MVTGISGRGSAAEAAPAADDTRDETDDQEREPSGHLGLPPLRLGPQFRES